jgi:tRNA(Arg) A34 adenosine deaminase TadA
MKDEEFMKIAIEEAKKGDFPFGAVITKDDKIISKSHNTLEKLDPTAHAEINAIREACKKLNTRDLTGCTLYITSEPCPMCFIVALRTGISKIFYGAEIEDLPKNLRRETDFKCSYLNEIFGNKISIKSGVLRDECIRLFKS